MKSTGSDGFDSNFWWYSSPLGEAMIESGVECIRRILPNQYFRVMLQVAGPPDHRYLDLTESEIRYRIGNTVDSCKATSIVAEAEWLPFAANSVDLLILPHVLEFSQKPHDILREVSQCIVPEGILVIAGFNPRSMLGMASKVTGLTGAMLQDTRFYSVIRIRDWLSLLGFEPVAGEFEFFRPPAVQASRLRRLKKLELAGARWWPGFGSIYILIVRKKMLGSSMNGTLMERTFRKRRRVLQPLGGQCRGLKLEN